MDNFTHSLAGWALGQAGLKTRSRKGLAALILGANMPDIDVFLGWAPWAPLATHRGFTHGVGGVLLLPPILAGLLWLLDRWQVRRGTVFRSGLAMNFRWLVGLSYIGTLTHPLLDLQTSYAVQLLAPFDTRWFHTESLFIIDVWIWSALAFAIWLSRRREKQGRDWRRPAMAGLTVVCAYVGLNLGITGLARAAVMSDMPHAHPDVLIAGEQPVLFWKRDMIWRQDGMIGGADYDPLRAIGHVTDIRPMVPDNMDNPLVHLALRTNPGLASFMRWSIMPVAQVHAGHCQATIALGDARFGMPAVRSRLMRTATLRLDRPGC